MNKGIYPPKLASMLVHRAGEKYRPSNGTEGDIFQSAFCEHCKRDKVLNGTVSMEDADGEDYCGIIAETMARDKDDPKYPQEWQIGADGQPCCIAFTEMDAPEVDTLTLDMFA